MFRRWHSHLNRFSEGSEIGKFAVPSLQNESIKFFLSLQRPWKRILRILPVDKPEIVHKVTASKDQNSPLS